MNVTAAASGLGLLTRTKHSKNGPVAPSARNHLVLARVTPAVPVPPSKGRAPVLGKYIARSAMIGAVALTSMPERRAGNAGDGAGPDRRAAVRRRGSA